MNLYKLENPCDPYTFYAADREIAAQVCLTMRGKVSATLLNDDGSENLDYKEYIPFFMFGNTEEWFQENYGDGVQERFKARKREVGEALMSLVIGTFGARKLYEKTLALMDDPEKKKAYAELWHDEKRSSVTDFGQLRKLGKAILDGLEEKEAVIGHA
jgi:hypothetical protein